MGRRGFILVAVMIIAAVAAPLTYFFITNQVLKTGAESFYFGVTYGMRTVDGAKQLIDKVQNYTNLFVVDSYEISTNKTSLDVVCNYASSKNMSFFVYFFSLYNATWQRTWVTTAKQIWGEKFLGVYLRDEPGGRQIDLKENVPSAANYSDAATKFITNVQSFPSTNYLLTHNVPIVTSDYALHWFDYKAGFNVVFAELVSNNSIPQQIAQCRGGASSQGKDWGIIIAWTYNETPYIENGPKLYQDMVVSYDAGARYVLIFNFPQYPENNQYGILTEEHFSAMQKFWIYAKNHPREPTCSYSEAVFVLPKDYGWAMRQGNDTIWGLWPIDNSSIPIGTSIATLLGRYGSKLDIIYDDNIIKLIGKYPNIYYWNQTVT
jgi:hypothetical protein